MLQETVGVLSGQESGMGMHAYGTAVRRLAFRITRAPSSRFDFVRVHLIFVNETKSAMMSSGQGFHRTRL